jgi:protein arginine kinase activator
MKCDKCGKNEATFYYKSNINGKVTEAHLCADCARESEYAKEFGSGMDGFMSGFMGDFMNMDRFFSPMHSFAGSLLGDGRDFFGNAFGDLNSAFTSIFPSLGAAEEDTAEQAPSGATDRPVSGVTPIVSAEESKKLNSQRELNALRRQMDAAVKSEDFETAAKIRDQIKAMQDK